MKPVVLLDCDGILANFIKLTFDILSEKCGYQYTPDDLYTPEIFDSVREAHRHLKDDVYDEMKRPGGCLSLPVYPGAQEGVARLRELAEVVIVTAPFHGSQTWAHEREQWLKQHFDIDHHSVIHARRKHHVHGHFLIDDTTSHVQSWQSYHNCHGGILWAQPYNADAPEGITRTSDWKRVCRMAHAFGRFASTG